jgi:hypothetical protein
MITGTSGKWCTVLAVVATVGLVDAAIGTAWDLVAVFALILALLALVAARHVAGRPSVPVRRDLVRWMELRAAAGGERVEDVVDRAVGMYRAGIVVERDDVEAR